MTKSQQNATLRTQRINEAFAAWGVSILSVTQTMPKTAPTWFRVNVADHREIEIAKSVADAVSQQYGINVVVVAW